MRSSRSRSSARRTDALRWSSGCIATSRSSDNCRAHRARRGGLPRFDEAVGVFLGELLANLTLVHLGVAEQPRLAAAHLFDDQLSVVVAYLANLGQRIRDVRADGVRDRLLHGCGYERADARAVLHLRLLHLL